ncbi:MAG: phage portal protein, partial [Lachnospiraceae bacterium]|nr:phage portal protein [Lachnospiraceae bacterium]
MDLSAFLNPIKEENCKFVASRRFIGEDGKPEQWEIKSITGIEDEEIKKSCMVRVAQSGKRGSFTQEFDFNKYSAILATACTVHPNLNSTQLQNAYGVMGAEDLLKKMLKPGE